MDESDVLPYLPRLDWVQNVRDPIWTEIPITEIERRIIQTVAFHRLRGIKQLGFAYLAFPGAVHTRFEHSLGVMHATDLLLKMVKRDEKNPIKINSTARQILRLAALLHDVGHPPFSHAMENFFTYYPHLVDQFYQDLPESFKAFVRKKKISRTEIHRHEVFTEYIICTDKGIRQVLFEWLEQILSETYAKDDILPRAESMIDDVISQLAVGKSVRSEKVPGDIAPPMLLFKSIMSGDIDADKIDYLMRDNYYCGLPHSHDLGSLRDQLVLDREGLKIHRGALKFVHSLLLARYRLITEVHQDKWDVFATARAIELLSKSIVNKRGLGEFFVTMFTQWNDAKLLEYLIECGGSSVQQILTTSYPLSELARLDYAETHPSIRACVDILSDPAGNSHLPLLQDELRSLSKKTDLVVHIEKVKLPEFSMRLVDGSDLLGDAILRGISEESVATLQLVVYGDGCLDVDLNSSKKNKLDVLPCESCLVTPKCIDNLENNQQKKLLAELVVYEYRKIIYECGDQKITIVDFLLLILQKVGDLCKQRKLSYPRRQHLYAIAQLLFKTVSERFQILGTLDLSKDQMTSSFHQQLRKYEQLGLIAYSRDIRNMESEGQPKRTVFQFDRRFFASSYGLMWLGKIGGCFERVIKEYAKYEQCWKQLSQALDDNEGPIIEILRQGTVDESSSASDRPALHVPLGKNGGFSA